MMDPQQQSIQSVKTRRYYTAGNSKAKDWWVLLHGFGQMPKYFIRHFEPFFNKQFFIAPEGLHRQYLKGTNGRVGASWMTKEAREEDIKDNLTFLDQLVQSHKPQKDTNIHVLGFSQGASTAARWAVGGTTKIGKVVLHSGVFPPDMDLTISLMGNPTLPQSWHLILGDEDPYPRSEDYGAHFQKFVESMKSTQKLEVIDFKGGHVLDTQSIANFMIENQL